MFVRPFNCRGFEFLHSCYEIKRDAIKHLQRVRKTSWGNFNNTIMRVIDYKITVLYMYLF